MNKRMDTKNNNRTKNKWIAAILASVLLTAIGFGLYFLIAQPESETTETSQKIAFSERSYSETVLEEIEIPEEPETPEGTVEDLREEEEEEEEVAEEPEDTPVAAPEPDLSSMIANAKTHVYTLHTDLEQGSGFLYNNKGDILTNAHVVKDAAYVTVTNSNGQQFNGRVIGISETTDIALVRVEDIAGKEPMEMEMSKVESGTPVFALGSPENISNTSSEGEITATGQSFFDEYEYNNLYEMNATIKQGSSGGPLISADSGKILGINSIILTDQPEIGYAIPIYTVTEQLNNWAADPATEEEEEVILPDVKDAYFDEELLTSFIQDFYELVPYSLNDDEIGYYLFFILPGSQAETAGQAWVDGMTDSNRVFEAAEKSVTNVTINEEEALIEAEATFTYHDQETGEPASIEHKAVYTVVIDEYGDYQISSIEEQ